MYIVKFNIQLKTRIKIKFKNTNVSFEALILIFAWYNFFYAKILIVQEYYKYFEILKKISYYFMRVHRVDYSSLIYLSILCRYSIILLFYDRSIVFNSEEKPYTSITHSPSPERSSTVW